MAPTDEQLVEAFQAGDVSAFDLLVSRWDRKIQGAVYRVVGQTEDVRDIAQEAFLKAYRALPLFKREAKFSSWLYQIALNLCRDRLRRRRRSLAEVSLDLLSESGELPLATSGPSAVELAEASELARTVGSAVWALPEEQREVIVLKEYQGLTFQEIAEVLGLPVSTVKTRLYRGLGVLRECLEQKGIRNPAPVPAPAP
ncbi:MAG TPA: sigma-70 family RNA polymerase sigma factor [Vicinamibacteria bacterium]|nr:sigma-70 family RNA polymerase sigma factor [Vicinamibacteria bacterium]